MDINFKLNDRQDSNQLSDQIINSADQVFKALLSDDLVQKYLMTGEKSEQNLVTALRRQKDAIETMEDSFAISMFLDIKELTDDPNEKQFFDFCTQGLKQTMIDYSNKFTELFGKLDPKLMDTPMTQWMYSYKTFALFNTKNGPFLRGLVPLLAMCMVCDRVLDYLKQNPNYSENKFAKMFLYEDWNFKQMTAQIRGMIDCRGDQVSDKEKEQLSELYRRGVAYERLVQNQNYTGGQWFDG